MFFSSRRRHTSWPRDWSSDVCSSDLTLPQTAGGVYISLGESLVVNYGGQGRLKYLRSEERRVGKECRALGTRNPLQQLENAQLKRRNRNVAKRTDALHRTRTSVDNSD